MYLIKDRKDRFVKITHSNDLSHTTNENLAEHFQSEREATDFLRKMFNKKQRKMYKVVQNQDIEKSLSDFKTKHKPIQFDNSDRCSNKYLDTITGFDGFVDTYLTPEIEKYSKELSRYDKQIQDIRHFIRDENTKLNACQGYQVFIKIQELERKRVGVKKELQRYAYLRARVNKAVRYFEDFEYEEYKNREIEDVRAFLFGG